MKRDLFAMNEMNLKFKAIIFFFCQQWILEFQKRTLFDGPGAYTDSRICV